MKKSRYLETPIVNILKAVKPVIRREHVDDVKETHGLSLRRACRIVG